MANVSVWVRESYCIYCKPLFSCKMPSCLFQVLLPVYVLASLHWAWMSEPACYGTMTSFCTAYCCQFVPCDAVVFAGGAKLGPKEQAYVAAVRKLNEAAAAKRPLDPISAFGAACEQYEDKTPNTLMSTCWKLLGDILAQVQAKQLSPKDNTRFTECMVQVSSRVSGFY